MKINFWTAVLCATLGTIAVRADELADGFVHPPDSSRPQTFWHWMNGNVSREGITADLEAMKKAGIGGVFLFVIEGQLTESVPVYLDKPVRHLTPEWFAMVRHAAAECKRLGIELSLMNCTGWTTSGGPWVPPEKSMMRIAWSEKYLKGPGRLSGPLPKPPCDYANYQNLTKTRPHIRESAPPDQRFYRDVAVLAYRLDQSAARTAALWPPRLTASEPAEHPQNAVDGDGATAVALKAKGFLQLDFGEPVAVRGVEYLGDGCALESSEDGTNWSKVADLPGPRTWDYPQTLPMPAAKAQYFRLFYPTGGSVRDVKLSGDSLVQDYQPKASFHGVWTDVKTAEDRIGSPTPPWATATIKAKDVLNLSHYLQPDGTLDWTAPEGDWMIVRLGCAPIGRLNAPCAREFAGLECNKLDPEAVEFHFNHYAGRVADELKDLVGSGFDAVHVDSWEAGDLNFTPKFVDEFRRRRGYDPTPYLLVQGGGRVVDSPAIADRFLWDARRTIADLLADNYFGKFEELCHQRGLKFQGEIAGVMVQTTVDQLQIKGRCDLPMGEFQMPNCVYGDNWARWDTREAASGAHIHGKPIAAAEAFTTFDRWMTDPYALKGIGDLAFSMGINRLVFHTWALHPWLDRAPGMTMGPFGVNFSRMNTWWGRPAKAYIDYLRRCQYLLQQGRPVADILYFYGEGAPNTLPPKPLVKPPLPDGYSYDGCDAETLLSQVQVNEGRLMLTNSLSYRVLVLKDDPHMTPGLLVKLRDLVHAGATVIGPKPIESPSLKDYPRCDEEVRKLADEVWGGIDGKTVTEHTFGEGRVILGTPVGEVLKSMNIHPDVEIVASNGVGPIEWTHRRSGNADIYFISNQQNIIDHGVSLEIWERRYASFDINELEKDTARFKASFRIAGRQPELWDAVRGTRRDLPAFSIDHDRTIVPLSIPPSGSCFIVFRRAIQPDQTKSPSSKYFPELMRTGEIEGAWTVVFDPKWAGPGRVTFDALVDWTKRPEPGIKFYSGRATYRKSFDAAPEVCTTGKRVFLDLGSLRSLAEVRLNGNDLGVLWCPPWRVEVTGLLMPTGNTIEIDIVNVWANRVIGDAALPKEQRATWTSLGDTIMALKPGNKLVPSGLYGPVGLYVEEN
ncbi:MAG: discoidin domain-containing protein [Candidatus Omnitrophica bacterium]|nr:discoidin domain-containing protein [Candidatus Omnitrophota bacterium]